MVTLPLQRPAGGKGSPAHKRQQEKETQIQLEVKCCVGKTLLFKIKHSEILVSRITRQSMIVVI